MDSGCTELMGCSGRERPDGEDVLVTQRALPLRGELTVAVSQGGSHAHDEVGNDARREREADPHAEHVEIEIRAAMVQVGQGHEEEAQKRVADERGAGHGPGGPGRENRCGDHQREQEQRYEGVGPAPGQVEHAREGGGIDQQMDEKLAVPDRPALPHAAPGPQVEGGGGCQDRAERNESERLLQPDRRDPDRAGHGSQCHPSQQEQTVKISA